jgi:hypothetical protein
MVNALNVIILALGNVLSYGATVYISSPIVDNPTGTTTAPLPVATTLTTSVTFTPAGLLNINIGDVIANSNTTDSVVVNAGDLIFVVFDQTIQSPVIFIDSVYNVFVGLEFA